MLEGFYQCGLISTQIVTHIIFEARQIPTRVLFLELTPWQRDYSSSEKYKFHKKHHHQYHTMFGNK